MIQRSFRISLLVGAIAAATLWSVNPPRVEEAAGSSYRVWADAAGVDLVLTEGTRVHFGRPRVVTDSESLPARSAAPRREGDRIVYDHGPWKEIYAVRPDSLQQMFLIERPLRADASIRVPVRSALRATATKARTISFEDAEGKPALSYSNAFALDSGGNVQPLALTLRGDEIGIELPKGFLEKAVYPVLVDPIVGSLQQVSPSGGIWKVPGAHIAWNPNDKLYLAVWHEGVRFDLPHGTHPPHNWLSAATIRARAIRVDAAGTMEFGDPAVPPSKPYDGVTLGPITTNYAAFGPRVKYNPTNNEFFVVWSEGQWLSDPVADENTNGRGEYMFVQDPYANNSRVVGLRVEVDKATLGARQVPGSTPVEISRATDGTSSNPAGTDPTAYHPAILPDISWDGFQYVVVWQTLENFLKAFIEAGPGYELRHYFNVKSRARYRLFTPLGEPKLNFTDLSEAKERFFVKGPISASGNIVDGALPTSLMNEKTYDSVPTDPSPHVDSLILPGPDSMLGTADDVPIGSLMIWNVTSLTFVEGKSRIRGKFLPANAINPPALIWEVYSSPGQTLNQIVQRASVAAGPGDDVASSHFMVAFESVEDTTYVGLVQHKQVEFIGSLAMRMVDTTGQPVGGVTTIATSEPTLNRFYLGTSVTWNREAKQYFVAWTQTDRIWNPITFGRSWYPAGGAFLDTGGFGPVATTYPNAVSASYTPKDGSAPFIDPTNPQTADHHVLYAGQEDDFGANFVARYKFPSAPSGPPMPPPGTPPPTAPSGGGDSEGRECGCGSVSLLNGPMALLLAAGLAALIFILVPARR